MPSLLRGEAERRARLLTVTSTSVELDLTDLESFRSTTTLRFTCTEPGAEVFVDIAPVELLRAELNGSPLPDPVVDDGRLTLTAEATNTLVLEAGMAYRNDGEGLHQHVDPADGRRYLYAMSFLDAAPRWFACFDQPDLKCSYRFTVHTPTEWVVAGNSPATQVRPGVWELAETLPLSTYFVTLVAGEWASVRDEHDGIPLVLHARQSLAEPLAREADDILEITKQSFDAYHELFGVRYPFGEYHQAFVPDFNAGAMENPGCVTFRDQFLFRGAATRAERGTRAGTIAHEMAHQWFGDLVTMRWWDDLWLNESFAEFMAHWVCGRATRYDLWPEFGAVRKDWGMVADQSPSTHPVAGNGSADAQSALLQFDGISYAKGAAVLRQLVKRLGEEPFLDGLRDYFARYRYGNADLADLIACWEAASGQDLAGWVEAWLSTSGLDLLRVADDALVVDRAGDLVRGHAIDVAALDTDGSEVGRVTLVTGDEPVPLDLGGLLVVPDAGDDTWARVRPAPGWDALPPIATIDDPLIRVVIDNSIRDGVRAADLDPAVAFDLLLAQAVDEPDPLLLRTILTFSADQLCGPYCPPASRSDRLGRMAGVVGGVLAASEPGSDRQLAALRLWLRSTEGADRLRSLILGAEEIPGRPLDEELRWTLVARLCSLTGEADLIDQTLGDDPSASAAVHAARCRAALPTEEAKRDAWALIMGESSLSAYELYATAEGFFLPEQTDLTAPYVPRYFAEIGGTAAFRRGWALIGVATSAFPAVASAPATLAVADETLAAGELHPALSRVLVDATDRLRRAVRSCERFGTSV